MYTMDTPDPYRMPVVAMQLQVVRREGDEERVQTLDFPLRDPNDFEMELVTDERGASLNLDVRTNKEYSILYTLRSHEWHQENGAAVSPYCDGLYSSTDVAGIKMGMQRRHEQEILKLENEIKKLKKRMKLENKIKKRMKKAKGK